MNETIYKFKPEVFSNIKSLPTTGLESLSPFFRVAYDSHYEFPPLEIYLYREKSDGSRKYRKTYTHMESSDGSTDFRDEDNVLNVGEPVTIQEMLEYNEIQENIIIEEAKVQLTDEDHYTVGY
jgi:hypothetical protein